MRPTLASIALQSKAVTLHPCILLHQTLLTDSLANWKADRIYSLPVLIGTPAQQFAVTIDTGSAALWVYGSACNSSLCAEAGGYDAALSSSAGQPEGDMEIKYGQGSTLGHWITDTVSLGGWAITGFEFGFAHAVHDQPWDGTDTSGILGLSWGMKGWAAPFWQTLAVQGAFADPRFGLYLARERDTRESSIDGHPSHEEVGGSLTLGGVDGQVIDGDITYLDVKQTHDAITFWRIACDGYSINGHSEPAPVDAIIDSGTSFIYLPAEDHKRFWSLVPGSQSMPLDEYGANWARYFAFPCQNASVIQSLELAFKFAGKEWKIQPTDLIYQPIQQGSLDGFCIGAVLDGTGIVDNFDGAWLVGDAFLKNVYSVYTYDPPRVGFAKIKSDFDLRIEGMDWVDRTPGHNKTLSPPPVGINQQTPTSVITVPAARTDGPAKNRIFNGAEKGRGGGGASAWLAGTIAFIISAIV